MSFQGIRIIGISKSGNLFHALSSQGGTSIINFTNDTFLIRTISLFWGGNMRWIVDAWFSLILEN
jgi:hypothetical protein